MFQRAARRAELPLCFSCGYHPLPRLAFGPPLQLGVASQADYVDMFLYQEVVPEALVEHFNQALPDGLKIEEAYPVELKADSLQASMSAMSFESRWLSEPRGLLGQAMKEHGVSLFADESAKQQVLGALRSSVVTRAPKKKRGGKRKKPATAKEFPLAEYLSDLNLSEDQDGQLSFAFTLHTEQSKASPNALEVLYALCDQRIGDFQLEKRESHF